MRRERDGAPQSILAETEEALIGFFIEGLRFEMQAGHMERAIANLQASLEYSCFEPAIPVGTPAMHAMPAVRAMRAMPVSRLLLQLTACYQLHSL